MEISGVVSRPLQRLSDDLLNTHSLKPSFSGRSITAGNWPSGDLRLVCSRNLKSIGFSTSGFSNNRRFQCYVSPICGGKKEEKKREKEKREVKKKMKLVKGLWKNLSMYSDQMGFLDVKDDSGSSEQGMIMSRASEMLLVHLLQLRAEEKEIKRKQKEEKAKLKASINTIKPITETSSADVDELRTEQKLVEELNNIAIQEESTTQTNSSISVGGQKKVTEQDHILLSLENSCCTDITTTTSSSSTTTTTTTTTTNSGGGSVVIGTSAIGEGSRIDVCMGGKCKKMGSEALLEELKNRVGIEGVVAGCKCMGKCRNAPNVRVVSKGSNRNDPNVRLHKPLYLGVGLEDVGAIVTNFLGEDSKDLGLMAA